jgi:hypothetical protein
VIDSRSPAADALLDYVDPGPAESVPARLAPAATALRRLVEAVEDWDKRGTSTEYPPSVRMKVRARMVEEASAARAALDEAAEEAQTLEPWYEADGSTVMLPVEEVTRRRKLAAAVLKEARHVAYFVGGEGDVIDPCDSDSLDRLREAVDALYPDATLPAAAPETTPAAQEPHRRGT